MKKLAFIILLSSAFATSNAQTNDSSTSGASFGFKGGVNFSNLYTDDVDDNNVLTGFNAGIFISLPLTVNVFHST